MQTLEEQAPAAVASLVQKSVAIGSGKGGVGKSTTALNLGLLSARRGLRVALVDLDPLSNIAVILDVAQETLDAVPQRIESDARSAAPYTVPLFPNFSLLFPRQKLQQGESDALRSVLFSRFAAELDADYDLLIFDMPAGISHAENLAFLPFMQTLLVVVQPEPTSQVSAGGYLKAALEIAPHLTVLLWHNRFAADAYNGLPAAAVISRYNYYVPQELKLTPQETARVRDFAYVPPDPALDLLQHRYSPETTLAYRIHGLLEMLQDVLLPRFPSELNASPLTRMRIRRAMLRERELMPNTRSVNEVGERLTAIYLEDAAAGEPFSDSDSDSYSDSYSDTARDPAAQNPLRLARYALYRWVATAAKSRPRRAVLRALGEADAYMEALQQQQTNRPSVTVFGQDGRRRLEVRLHSALQALNEAAAGTQEGQPTALPTEVRHAAGVLLFYTAMLKLQRSDSVRRRFNAVVPRRKGNDGRVERDRRAQIANLIEHNGDYHARFLGLIRALFPVITRQIGKLTRVMNGESLLLKDGQGAANSSAYLRLLTRSVHEALHSGLGVVVGLPNTPAYNATGQAERELVRMLRLSGHARGGGGAGGGGADGRGGGRADSDGDAHGSV